jgi:hypothetical protein
MIEVFLNPYGDLYYSFSDEINSIKSCDPVFIFIKGKC